MLRYMWLDIILWLLRQRRFVALTGVSELGSAIIRICSLLLLLLLFKP